jgi:hypothetical protein
VTVTDRLRSLAVVVSLIGGLCLFLAGVPPGWYGYEPGVSYVFDPAVGSPLWIERVLVPVLSILGTVGLLGGIAAVVRREWGTNRLIRWAGTATVLGGVAATVGLYGPDLLGPPGMPEGPLAVLSGLAVALWGAILLLVGGPLLAYGLLGAGIRRLSWTLLAVVPGSILLSILLPGDRGAFLAALPWLALGSVLAWELWIGPQS